MVEAEHLDCLHYRISESTHECSSKTKNHVDIRFWDTCVTADIRKASLDGSTGAGIDNILYRESNSISVSQVM